MLDLTKLHSNQRLLVEELMQRGVIVELLDAQREIIKAVYQNHTEYLYDRDTSIVPYNLSVIVGNKGLTKKILIANQISVPLGETYDADDIPVLLCAFHILGEHVTLKPAFGSHGYDVYVDIKTEKELMAAVRGIQAHLGQHTEVVIEEHYEAKEYRIFITRNGDYAVLEREPASVIGDGVHTINQLIQMENYRRMHPRSKAWCEIYKDSQMERFMNKQGLSYYTVPRKDKKVFLRPNSNVAMGGLPIDRTDDVHPTAIEIAKQTLNAFQGLPYIGIDFMTEDIKKPQNKDTYKIIEINTVPGVDMHYRPAYGKPRNIAKYMADLIYPETKKGS